MIWGWGGGGVRREWLVGRRLGKVGLASVVGGHIAAVAQNLCSRTSGPV